MGGDTLDPLDVAWAAGYLDGEGYFGLDTGNNTSPDLIVDSVQPASIRKLHRMFGGRFSTWKSVQNDTTVFRWRAHGDTARAAARLVLPHLQIKTVEAYAMIEAIQFGADTAFGKFIRARALANRRWRHKYEKA